MPCSADSERIYSVLNGKILARYGKKIDGHYKPRRWGKGQWM
jgi:hypothetical protein